MRWLALLLLLAFLGVALVYPLSQVLLLGWQQGWATTWQNPYYWGRLLWSLGYGLASSFLVLLLALPLAWLFRFNFPGRRLLLALATLPFVMPPLVVAMGYLSLVGPQGLGPNLYGTPWILLWGSVFYNVGLVLRMLLGLLGGLETPLEAARTLGASPWQAMLRVAWPLLRPGLLAGGAIVFLYSFGSFALPLLLGGPAYATLEVEVYQLLAFRLAFPEAAALVVVQLLVAGLATALYLGPIGRNPIPLEAAPLRLARRPWLITAALGLGFVVLYSPLLALLLRFKPDSLAAAFASTTFTPAGLALLNTLAFAALAMAVVLPLAWLYAWLAQRHPPLEALAMLPLWVSPVALGVGYLLVYPQWGASVGLLIAAYALLSFPLLARALLVAWRSLPPELSQVAQTLGATRWQVFRRVEFPLLRTAFRAGAALSLAAVVGEFGATMLLRRPEWATLSTAIYERLGRPGQAPLEEAVALSVLLLLLAGVLFVGLDASNPNPNRF